VEDFESFYRSSRDGCFRALLVTVRDVHEADDLLAESYARALARWDNVGSHPAPKAWIIRTALNLHRDRWRRMVRHRRLRTLSTEPSTAQDVDADPEVLRALFGLPSRQRQVVALRVLAQMDTEETAIALGIAPGTVTTHLHRGLSALREQLTARKEAP